MFPRNCIFQCIKQKRISGAKGNAKTIAARCAHTVVPLAHFSHGADILRQIEKEGKPNYTHKTFLQANRDDNLT